MGKILPADIEYAVIIALVIVLVFAFVRAQFAISDFEGRWTDGEGNMFVIERRPARPELGVGSASAPHQGGASGSTAGQGHRLRILSAVGIGPRRPGQPTITSHAADVKLFRRLCTADGGAASCARLSLDGRYLEWGGGAGDRQRRWHKNGVL